MKVRQGPSPRLSDKYVKLALSRGRVPSPSPWLSTSDVLKLWEETQRSFAEVTR